MALVISGSLSISGSVTAETIILSSSAVLSATASQAQTASYAVTASYVIGGGGGGAAFPFTGDAQITGSLNVTGSITLNNAVLESVLAVTGSSIYSVNPATSDVHPNNSIFVGYNAGAGGGSGASDSVMIGFLSGYSATKAKQSAFLGISAGNSATHASESVMIGDSAGFQAFNAGNSILIGAEAGYNTSLPGGVGRNNIIIGTRVTLENGRRDSINIGGLIFGTGSYFSTNARSSDAANGRIGINQPLPNYSLDVSGSGNYSNGLTVTGSIKVSQNLIGGPESSIGNPDLMGSVAFGAAVLANAAYAHAEGSSSYAAAVWSHAEGQLTVTQGIGSHAEGQKTLAFGDYSHAEGGAQTTASGQFSHAEGSNTVASGTGAHSEGNGTRAIGFWSHAEGQFTVAQANYQHVVGSWNMSSSLESAFIVGNGTSDFTRKNLVFAGGNELQITGSLLVTGSATIYDMLVIVSQSVLPATAPSGAIMTSGSNADFKPYFWNGATWTSLI